MEEKILLTRILDFHKHSKIVKKSWGYEKIIANDSYCLKVLSVNAKQGCSMHYHLQKQETFYVVVGVLKVEFIDPDSGKCSYVTMKQGESITIHQGQAHRFTAVEHGAEFIEASTYDDPKDSYRVCASNLDEPEWRYGSSEAEIPVSFLLSRGFS